MQNNDIIIVNCHKKKFTLEKFRYYSIFKCHCERKESFVKYYRRIKIYLHDNVQNSKFRYNNVSSNNINDV